MRWSNVGVGERKGNWGRGRVGMDLTLAQSGVGALGQGGVDGLKEGNKEKWTETTCVIEEVWP